MSRGRPTPKPLRVSIRFVPKPAKHELQPAFDHLRDLGRRLLAASAPAPLAADDTSDLPCT